MACSQQENVAVEQNNALFENIKSSHSGVDFKNKLQFTEAYNPYTFKNFLNGGGVAIGDINNDGLPDLYFTGNLVANKLYLNQGNFKFKDISSSANVSCKDTWSTGAAFVDINHDGLLDLFVAKSGEPNTPDRANQMFINNGDLTFTDQAKSMNLDFVGLSIQAAFLDYDKDGDLDCYLLNNSIRSVGAYDIAEDLRDIPNPDGGNKLLKNLEVETGEIKFENVSAAAGIYNSAIGFGLGVSVADLNNDNWDDIFVSNDFFEKDYLYINQKDGTFKEVIDQSMAEISMGSMGADIADLNNDLLPDLFVTEMLPESLERYKSKTVFDSYDKYKLNKSKGYHNQYGRNVLQYNLGNQNEIPQFVELARYHGVEATDWSWGALLADFDNNGHKDIFVANGIYKDLLDQDHINFYHPQKIASMIKEGKKDVITTIVEAFPSEPLDNHLYLQNDKNEYHKTDLFENQSASYSNGSAYGDLDNDGDLDLVLNNINSPASIFRNNMAKGNFLKVSLIGKDQNVFAIGTKVFVYTPSSHYLKTQNPMRGYQSSVDYQLLFGLGGITTIDSVIIVWPDLSRTRILDAKINSTLTINIANNSQKLNGNNSIVKETLLEKVDNLFSYQHQENQFSDFDRNRLLFEMISNEGPKAVVTDINDDGKDDVIIAGSVGKASQLYVQANNQFSNIKLGTDEDSGEAKDFIVHDFNKDNKKDILILNGGSQFNGAVSALRDQLYLNSGKGFKLEKSMLSNGFKNHNKGIMIDIDQDQDLDLLIGARTQANAFGLPVNALLMENNDGAFKSIDFPALNKLGMVTDMETCNINNDDIQDLLIARDFNSISYLESGNNVVTNNGLDEVKGRWNDIVVIDIDKDGDEDIIACNMGLNTRYKNMTDSSLYLFINDFDSNGSLDNVYCIKDGDAYKPIHLKDELIEQIPLLKKRILKYEDYAVARMSDLFPSQILERSVILEVNEFQSGIFYNNIEEFTFKPLPKEVQYSTQMAVWVGDLNQDDWPDIVVGGNQFEVKPEIGMQAASFGHVLTNQKDGTFKAMNHQSSGFFENGQIRDIEEIKVNNQRYLLVLKNNEAAAFYKIKN